MTGDRPEGGGEADRLLTLSLPFSPEAPGRARRAVSDLTPSVGAGRVEDLRLLVSELVTNSLRHARPRGEPGRDRIEVAVYRRGDVVRVEVADPGDGFTWRPAPTRRDRDTGWGFQLVEELSDVWGVSTDRGTRVWFELPSRNA